MQKPSSVAFLALSIVIFVSGAFAQEFTSAHLIQASKFLEAKPYDKDAEAIRGAAVRYVIETKEASVTVCGGAITKPLLEKKNKNSTELIGQYTIATAAFKLANPSQKDDENTAQLAALESVLRTYETMIKEKPKTKFAMMDEYIQKRDRGELKALVDAANCGKK